MGDGVSESYCDPTLSAATTTIGDNDDENTVIIRDWLKSVHVISSDGEGDGGVLLTKCKKTFEDKCQLVRDCLKDNKTIHWVMDWDRTCSLSVKSDGSRNHSSFGVLENAPFITEKARHEFEELHDYYMKIEWDINVPHDEKAQHMIDWSDSNQKRIIDQVVTKERLRDACIFADVHLRDEFIPHLKEILAHRDYNVTIYSAGISTVIREILTHHEIQTNDISVLGNELIFEGNLVTSWSTPMITPENKCTNPLAIEHAAEYDIHNVVIAVGDSVHDVGMMEPFNKKKVGISIGIFNHTFPDRNLHDKHRLQTYLSSFDIVVCKTVSWKPIRNIVSSLFSQ